MGRPLPVVSAFMGLIVLAAVIVGVALRVKEPLSSPALGAEDPFTHVVFTKEALQRGWFGDSQYLGIEMYPPGIHAFAGALAPIAGVSVYDFARWSPIAFGALAIIGMYVLGARLAGPVAGGVAAILIAVMPEHIIRTNIFFPTAMDLALLPAFLIAFHEATTRPTLGSGALFMVMATSLAFLHPWAVPLFVGPAALAAALHAIRSSDGAHSAALGMVPAAGLAVLAMAFAFAARWRVSDTGFADFFAKLPVLNALATLQLPAWMLFLYLVVILGLGAILAVAVLASLATLHHRSPRALRFVCALVVGVVLLGVVYVLSSGHLPPGVKYEPQLGRLAIGLGLAGVLIALLVPTALGDLALMLALLLFPLTAVNIFQGQYWPQRTMVYLAIPVVLLAGGAVASIVKLLVERIPDGRPRRMAAPALMMAGVLLVAGSVAGSPPRTWSWYHLYPDEDFHGFERTADALAASPKSRVVVGSWQPSLMVKTLSTLDAAWYSPKYYNNTTERDKIHSIVKGTVYVVVDKYVLNMEKAGKAKLSFLEDGKYDLVYSTTSSSFRLYEVRR